MVVRERVSDYRLSFEPRSKYQEGASQVKIWGRISFLEVRVAWRGTAWLGCIE